MYVFFIIFVPYEFYAVFAFSEFSLRFFLALLHSNLLCEIGDTRLFASKTFDSIRFVFGIPSVNFYFFSSDFTFRLICCCCFYFFGGLLFDIRFAL